MTSQSRRAEMLERFVRYTDLPLLILALVMVPVVVVPFVMEVDEVTHITLETVDWIIWGVFAADLTIRTYLSEQRLDYLRSHWFDVLIVALPMLRPLRFTQSVRVFRLLRLTRLLPILFRIGFSARRILQRRGMQYVLFSSFGAVLGCSGLVLVFEQGHGGTIQDFGTALWWAIATVTTVGYGDAVPVTLPGKGLAIFLMVIGISLFSWLTANIAAFLVEGDTERERAVTLEDVMTKLESLEDQLQALKAAEKEEAVLERR